MNAPHPSPHPCRSPTVFDCYGGRYSRTSFPPTNPPCSSFDSRRPDPTGVSGTLGPTRGGRSGQQCGKRCSRCRSPSTARQPHPPSSTRTPSSRDVWSRCFRRPTRRATNQRRPPRRRTSNTRPASLTSSTRTPSSRGAWGCCSRRPTRRSTEEGKPHHPAEAAAHNAS